MKSLLIKTLLIVSAVTITSVLAFSVQDCNPEWKKGVVCDQTDKNLETHSGGASNEPVKTYCESCGAEMRSHARMDDATTAHKGSSGSTTDSGGSSTGTPTTK